jgi:hypothetical protein
MTIPDIADARSGLHRVERVLLELGVRYTSLDDHGVGVGVSVAWGDEAFLVVSVPLFNPHTANITAGVLRDVERDRLAVLDACNRRNQSNPAWTYLLHDAELGWDVIVQQSFPIQLLVDVPPFLGACLEPTVHEVEEALPAFREAGVGGRRHSLGAGDAARVMSRGLI